MPPKVRENREKKKSGERACPAPRPDALKQRRKAVEAWRSSFDWARGAFSNPSSRVRGIRVFDFGLSGVGRFGRQGFLNSFGGARGKFRGSTFDLNFKIKTSSRTERITPRGQVQARGDSGVI